MRMYANNLPVLIVAIFLIMAPYRLAGSDAYPSLVSEKGLISEITSVNEEQTKSGTTISIAGNGAILQHVTETHDFPPMIVIDIIAPTKLLKSRTVPVKTHLLKKIRIGYHQKKIRIVLDIKGKDIPLFTTKIINNRLTVSLETVGHEKKERDGNAIPPQTRKTLSRPEILTVIKADDGQADTVLFRKAVNAYKEQDWQTAIHELNELIKVFPEGKYAENAYFLLAKVYDSLHPHPMQNHFKEVKDHYDNAVKKFPKSKFVPDAILSTGNLYFKAKSYHRAMTFYNLILKKHKYSEANPKALLKIVKIMDIKKRYKDAISGINYIISNYPGFPEETEAKITMAKIAYERNSFHKSITILTELIKKNPENLYRYPEISLYLGYNYFQLGKSLKARINLLRFYNSCPEKNSHLILTKVGDTYLDEGSVGNAVKFYYLVLKRYPKTEGAIISKIRIAKQQEKGDIEKNIVEKIGSPKKIYEDIIGNPLEKNRGNPFEQLAMLRLANIHEKEKDYNTSLEYLKDFLKKYPRSSLKTEAQHSFNNVIGKILDIEMKAGRYYTVLDIYKRESRIISKANSPYVFLPVARAFMHLSFDSMAAKIFKMADKFLPDTEKPSDLLYSLSMDSFKKKNLEEALIFLNLLIKNHPNDPLTPYAYKLKGEIFFKQRKFLSAADFFERALKFNLKPCEKALNSIMKVDNKKLSFFHQIYQDIGDLYLQLGYANNALAAFNQALEVEEAEENKTLLKIKIARCYKILNKKNNYMPIYGEIASLENVLWSNIAKYEIEGVDFDNKIMKKSIK